MKHKIDPQQLFTQERAIRRLLQVDTLHKIEQIKALGCTVKTPTSDLDDGFSITGTPEQLKQALTLLSEEPGL